MKRTDNDTLIPEHDFDVLLRHALLENEKTFNELNLDHMANELFAATGETISAAEHETSVVEKLLRDLKPSRRNFRLNIFLLVLFAGATIAVLIHFTSSPGQPVATVQPAAPQPLQAGYAPGPVANIPAEQLTSNPTPHINPVIASLFDSIAEEENLPGEVFAPSSQRFGATTMHIPEDNFAYEEIPTLSEAAIKQTAKDKLNIMRDVVRKRVYAHLPGGATNVNGTLTTLNGFAIKNAEITNYEYRTFLNDLLIQGRHEDYLLARPAKGKWTAIGLPEFETRYEESPRFNEYPAVNMTRKGAELYCEWMTASMNEAIAKKEVKWNGTYMPMFRLPCNVEWIYAARGCDTLIQTPWAKVAQGHQNKRGCYLCNFNYSVSKDKLSPEGPGNGNNGKAKDGCISPNPPKWPIVTTAGRSIDTLLTAPVYSYNPNSKGAYCMLGNVSEMVWTWESGDNPKGAARSMGGSWFSHVDNVLIEAPEQYVGVTEGQAYIGFRTVMVW
jgi:formylglycine-generating enzyme required for sulfatase activity